MKQVTGTSTFLYYIGIVLLFLLLKWANTFSTNHHLLFLLAPTNAGIEILTASQATYTDADGFRHNNLSIIIDRSCSGINFWLLSFSLLALSTLHFYITHKQKLLARVCLLAFSYLATVLVNISRITVTLLSLKYKSVYSALDTAWMHEAQGSFIYLVFLIILYISIRSFTVKLTKVNAHPR